MRGFEWKWSEPVIVVPIAFFFTVLLSSPTYAADHLDSPMVILDPSIDITDVYAFHPGPAQRLDRTVFVMNVNPLSPAGLNPTFSSEAAYEFNVDNTGDAVADLMFRMTFSEPNDLGIQDIQISMGNPTDGLTSVGSGKTESNSVIPIEIDGADGKRPLKLFAGLRDDPFFFDLASFKNSLSFCQTDPATDTFARTNVSAIVLEVPTFLLGGPNIGMWASISQPDNGSFVQVDRMGRPAINTVLIPSGMKNSFNAGVPADDPAVFGSTVEATLTALGATNPAGLTSILLPDVLTVDLSTQTGFLNGRNLADDVIDAELALVSGGALTSDCVDGNDVAFSPAFPYLAKPHKG